MLWSKVALARGASLLVCFGLIASLAVTTVPARAAGADCPLARQPYSSRTPLIDLQLDPRAKAVIDREAPGLDEPPGAPAGTRFPPGFSAISTPEWLLKLRGAAPEAIARLDQALAGIELAPSVIKERCARYDETPPQLPQRIGRPAILVFEKINGFRDDGSVRTAASLLNEIAARRGWSIVSTESGAAFNPADLARFDVVIWNNVSGDALTLAQRRAFRRWIERGGGFAGLHGAGGDPVYFWDWYVDELIGARFSGHPMTPQFQEARVVVDDRSSAIVRGLGDGWSMSDEWYSFAQSPRKRGAHVLARLDERSYMPVGPGGADLRMGDHPIAWTRCVRSGRSFYTAIGHRPESYHEPHSAALIEAGIAWAAGLGETRCMRGAEVANSK